MQQVNAKPESVTTQDAIALLMRMTAVTRMTGLSRSTIYKLMAERRFPSPVRLSSRAVAWRRADLERWSEERPPTTH